MKFKQFIPAFFILFLLPLLWKNSGAYLFAQQLPYYSQFKTNMYMINPGITGTKRTIDARLNHRSQWVGFEGAPKTTSFSLHSRFLKGKMGAGFSFFNDEVGPSKKLEIGGNYAYHLKFPDVELSVGAGGHGTKYTLNTSKITTHNNQDPAVDMASSPSDWLVDASFGAYLYNDRFHIGISGIHFIESKAQFYEKDSAGFVKYATHANFTLGYNYSSNRDYVLESTFLANYAKSAPISLNLTMRLHYKSKVFAGYSFRPGDAFALHVGATLLDYLQVSYSYDILTTGLKSYSKGSHEIMLSFSYNFYIPKSRFIHERYAYMF